MKWTVFFFLAGLLHVSAGGYSQKITLKGKQLRLQDVFLEIRRQTGYEFLYNPRLLKTAPRLDMDMQEMPLPAVLDACLQGLPFTYSLVDRTIVVSPRQLPAMQAPAAGITLRGRVTNAGGEGLPAVSIRLEGGEGNGVRAAMMSDNDGNFRLEGLKQDTPYTLVCSLLGFEAQRKSFIAAPGMPLLHITLKEKSSSLNELVVVGYESRKKASITGALSTLNMKERENQPVTNLSQAMHGVSGLWVNQAGGKPGQDGASIRIRGVGTLNNSAPLVLVDGIEYDMNEVNPAFIESVTVLKDASAAIYGSRAANGVILVTTKQGRKGKMKVEYNFSHGIQEATYMPDVVWDPIQYMQLKNTALRNEGKVAVDYPDALIEEYKQGMKTDPLAYPAVNWFDVVMKRGYLQQHNLRFSGGTDALTYNMAIGFMDQDGILAAANHARRYTFDLGLKADISKRLQVGASVIGNRREFTEPAYLDDATATFFNRLTRALPIFGTYLPDGRYANLAVPTPSRSGTENLLQYLHEGFDRNYPQRILAKVFATYRLPLHITYNVNFGIDKLDGVNRKFQPIMETYNPQTWVMSYSNPIASALNYSDNNLNLTLFQTLNWETRLAGSHHLSLMLGQSWQDYRTSSFRSYTEGYFDNTLTDLDAGSLNPSVAGKTTRDLLASYFGKLAYGYRDKYLVEATFRYDGSSRFAPAHRWGLFPSLAAAWRIDQEAFFPQSLHIDMLKLRASVGKMGNQQTVSLYSYMNTVSLNQDYSFHNKLSPGAAATSYSDPGISWEATTSWNGGLDLEAWNGKLGFSADVFKRRTSGILRTVAIPAQVGALGGPTRNVGVVDNTGYELSLRHRNSYGPFSYEVEAGISYVKNLVVDLDGETIINGRRIVKEGYPIDAYYLYHAAGIYQSEEEIKNSVVLSNAVKPGYIRYTDVYKDGKLDGNDRFITGSSIPRYNYSFAVNLHYRDLSLNTFFQGVQGIDVYPTLNLATPFNNGAGVTKEWVTDSWTPERRNARLPILTTATGATENFQNSTFWLKDASYLRLKNVQLSYSLNGSWMRRLSLSRLQLFVNGQNLLTFSGLKMFDPEKNITNDNLYEYPSLKTYSFGLNATF